ncbi:competence/damage-inducible protein A [bacterium]|nr:competence/damage-inducible protein A [bacterium]NIN92032.1 competence/damage-inducible protein A [bacterium]NIO18248.1 competence/damage-inducible protein A [bacterium]NIO73222.1 competence/damage-inducible protein A [bacterium]
MKVEMVSVGSELLKGKINTDIAYLGEKLDSIGLAIDRETTVGDDREKIESILQETLNRSDIIITTGGLGPTFDDLTREVMAKVLKKKLVFDREVMHQIAAHFANRDLEMPKNNERQAYIIEGAKVIPNKVGTAPGMIVERKTKAGSKSKVQKASIIIMLPGPPREMKPMVEEVVLPYLKEKYERKILKKSVLHISGLTESAVYEKIQEVVEIERRMEGGILRFSILAHLARIDVEISGEGENELLVDEMLHKARQEIYDCLEDYIYGEGEDTLESVVGGLLLSKRLTLAVAESCTGGLIGDRITDVAGSSVYFKEGIVAYSNEAKVRVLGVKEDTVNEFGAVSRESALEMANGIQRISETDIGLATTGIAGPTGGTAKKPVGLVYVALVWPKMGLEICKEFHFSGKRREIKESTVINGLDILRKALMGKG